MVAMNQSDPLSSLGRGVFALKSFQLCRRPGKQCNGGDLLKSSQPPTNDAKFTHHTAAHITKPAKKVVREAPPIDPKLKEVAESPKEETELFAKYSYSANPNRPGGFDELSFKQSDRLWLIRAHPANEHWLEARHENGTRGYIPTSYMKIVEKKVAGLPWLQKSTSDPTPQERTSSEPADNVFGAPPQGVTQKQPIKAYVPSYGTPQMSAAQADDQFYCALCDKQLNGPLPYRAHMSSKYHKEEVQARKHYS